MLKVGRAPPTPVRPLICRNGWMGSEAAGRTLCDRHAACRGGIGQQVPRGGRPHWQDESYPRPVPLRLRDYLYLDEALVERLLSQVEGGVAGKEAQTNVDKIDKRRGAALRAAHASAELGRTKASEVTASKTITQTPDSVCSRLIETLERDDALQFLEAFDEQIWVQLQRGEALEIEASLELSGLVQLAGIAEAFGPMAEIMSAVPGGEQFDAKALEALKGFVALAGTMRAIPVIARPAGTDDYTFVTSLKRDALRVGQDELTGDATIFGTLQRRLKQGESWSVLDVMGFSGLPRELRRKMEKDLSDTEEISGLVVKPPAALLTPIAIYR